MLSGLVAESELRFDSKLHFLRSNGHRVSEQLGVTG